MNAYRIRPAVMTAGFLAVLCALAGCPSGNGDTGAQQVSTSSEPAVSAAQPTPSTGQLPEGAVELDSPKDEAEVKRCEIFKGRANLPDDKTIIIGVRNKDNHNPERYFEAVTDWEYPEDLDSWTGMQWFGDADSAVGQSFRVEVLIVDLELARSMNRQAKEKGWHSPENPDGAEVAAHIDLDRVKGAGPKECS
ncbi:hypothetical protein ACQP2E_11840 [Actinoplanes sp. CA-015351]|uniref:hypothetical protein n=1 Tax=Actinoplanes sp. CA-015351 TaxID=3239897 RepID=UPI003D972E33